MKQKKEKPQQQLSKKSLSPFLLQSNKQLLIQQQPFYDQLQQAQNTKQLTKVTDKAQQMLQQILHLTDPITSTKLIQKFTIHTLVSTLDKNKLQSIDKIYNMKPQGFNLLEFIRFFLNAIQHQQTQTLYLTIGLVDLFKAIAQNNNSIEKIKFIHLTDFICGYILQTNHLQQEDSNNNKITGCTNNSYSQNKIDMKLVPQHNKIISPDYQIKPYVINPPIIYGNKDQQVYKLSQSNIKTDKNKHDSVVTCCHYSNQYKKVFSLDALAEAISIYDVNCKLERKLKPQNFKIKKDVVLLSFAYSQRQQRIGAVLKDFSMSFWDFNDNLQFQKVISTASSCQQYQTNIWYLEYFQSWITSDKTGIIYIWNLQKQLPQRRIQCKFRGKINDVCEIPCLNILAVAQQARSGNRLGTISSIGNNNNINNINSKQQPDQAKIILYDYFRGQQVATISTSKMPTDMRIPHTLQYSQSYQVLLSAGFEKKINIFEINHQYLDISLKGELLGHQNLITHFTLVKKTPMVVSCDDKGKVKIWDLRSYKCIQTLNFQDKTVITRLLDMVQVGKFGVLGSRINILEYDQRQDIIKKHLVVQKLSPLNINFIYQSNKLLITTKKDLRVYSMRNGSIQKVYCSYHSRDEQIVLFKYYEHMKKLLITNEKGEIKLMGLFHNNTGGDGGGSNVQGVNDSQGGELYGQRLEGYSNGMVTHVEYDQENKLFVTCGGNGTINVHKFVVNNNNANDNNSKDDNNKDSNNNNGQVKGNNFQPNLNKKLLSTSKSKYHNNNNNTFDNNISSNNTNTNNKKNPNNKHYSNSQQQSQWQIIRQMKGNFNNKDITTISLSVYHSMIAIGSNSNRVYVWDYEYAKLLFQIILPQDVQPTAMSFINSYSMLLIAVTNGELYFVRLMRGSGDGNINSNINSNQINNQQQQLKQSNKSSNIGNNNNVKINQSSSSQHILTFRDNRQVIVLSQNNINDNNNKNNNIKNIQLSQYEDPTDYITELIIDISIKSNNNNTQQKQKQQQQQPIQFAKLYIAYTSGKICIMELSQLLNKLPTYPHRKTLPTYNAQRQLKEQFNIQLQKQKTYKVHINHQLSPHQYEGSTTNNKDKQQNKNTNTKQHFQYPYEFLKPHAGSINSMKILQFDKHYLITSSSDERVKVWGDILEQQQYNKNINNNLTINKKNNTNPHISTLSLLGDFNINHPLPYLWNFMIKDDNKLRDKIMFSLKIIQSIFKKFGSDISTGQARVLKLQKFFQNLYRKNNNVGGYKISVHGDSSSKRSVGYQGGQQQQQDGYNYLTQPKQQKRRISSSLLAKQQQHHKHPSRPSQQQHQLQTSSSHNNNNNPKKYLFQQQFTTKDLHFQQIKKHNFYQIGGPSLRQLQFRKKMQTMQKQWQVARQKQQEQKDQLMAKIVYKAQKNEQKQQIMGFLQDRRLLGVNNNIISGNNNSNTINNKISKLNYNNNNNPSTTTPTTNRSNIANNPNTNTKQQQPPQQSQQIFPAVKRISQQLKRIQSQQQLQSQLLNNNNNNNNSNMLTKTAHNFSYTFMNNSKFSNSMSGGGLGKVLYQQGINNNNNCSKSKYVDNNNNSNGQNMSSGIEDTYLLKKYYSTSKSNNINIKNNNNPKGFQQYYSKINKLTTSKSNFIEQQQQQQQQQQLNNKYFYQQQQKPKQYQSKQRINKLTTSHSKTVSTMSLINSRSISHQSLHKRTNNNNVFNTNNNKDHLTFQTILKDMNNRVLLSRQGRTTNVGRRGNNQQFQEGQMDSQKVFLIPTQRQKRSKRMGKTTHFNTQPSFQANYNNGNKIN